MTEATALPGWTHHYSGKVRNLYLPEGTTSIEQAERILVVASDRVSAFDHVLKPAIPGKGALLTRLSLWWFAQLPVPNHLIDSAANAAAHDAAATTPAQPADSALTALPKAVAAKAMLVKRLNMHPVECVVRGYLTGSGWEEYRASQSICGIHLPTGLQNGDRLPAPIYTPAYKAPLGEHDENISFERTVELVGAQTAAELRELSLSIYRQAAEVAAEHGVILADTKFEFGCDPATGKTTLADEVLTSDSSRYWDAVAYQNGSTPAERMASFDKQIVRNWLAAHWDKQGTPPALPAEIVTQTAARYHELIDRLGA